jgi:hypothetical protein
MPTRKRKAQMILYMANHPRFSVKTAGVTRQEALMEAASGLEAVAEYLEALENKLAAVDRQPKGGA